MNFNSKVKEYYTLKELIEDYNIDLKNTQLYKRVKDIYYKYNINDKLIYKVSNVWYIHNSLSYEFERKRYYIDYKLLITISCKNNLDDEYWRKVISNIYRTLKLIDNTTRLKYVIEKTKNNISHIHFITTFDKIKVISKIMRSNHLTNDENGMNRNIKKIYEVKGIHKYFRKQNKPVLLR